MDGIDLKVLGLAADRRLPLRTDAPALLVTLESGMARVVRGGKVDTLDRSGCLVVPRGTRLALGAATSSAGRVAIASFREPLVGAVARAYAKIGVTTGGLAACLRRYELLPRTVWVHEIVHRYVFERFTMRARANAATRFLEAEILKEVFFLFRDRDAGADRSSLLRKHTPCVQRAVAHIESHLFEECSVTALAAAAGASASTLLRAFRRELASTPAAYWRTRRLDEALLMLRSGERTVGEIASLVGYDNAPAFSYAFRQRFGRPPSSFRPRRPEHGPPCT